jgi:sugar lactone lactonase YvrE
MSRKLTVLISGDFSFFEGPRWHDNRLWISDMYTHRVLAAQANGSVETILEVPGQPSGLGWLPDGDLLVVSMKDRRILRFDGQRTTVHADLSETAPCHLNDMVVDAQGRAYVGNFGADILHGEPITPTAVYRVDPEGGISIAARDLYFPNGLVVTEDGRFVVAETVGNRITQFDIEPDGSLVNRRPLIEFGAVPDNAELANAIPQLFYAPDGMVGDAEGAVWFADVFGRRAVRVLDGELVDEISTAPLDLGTFSVTLGGPDGRTLFFCSAPSFAEADCRARHRAQIVAATVDVPHAGCP